MAKKPQQSTSVRPHTVSVHVRYTANLGLNLGSVQLELGEVAEVSGCPDNARDIIMARLVEQITESLPEVCAEFRSAKKAADRG